MRLKELLVLACCISLATIATAQNEAKPFTKPATIFTDSGAQQKQIDSLKRIQSYRLLPVRYISTVPSPEKALLPSYYADHIGFFCKKELQLEKAVRIPIKLRLGSVAYTDKMEGKGSGKRGAY